MTDTETLSSPEPRWTFAGAHGFLLLVLVFRWSSYRIWEEEPAGLRRGLIAMGCLLLLGCIVSWFRGARLELFGPLLYAVSGLFMLANPVHADPEAAADASTLLTELSERGAEIQRVAASLPSISEDTGREELEGHLRRALARFAEQRASVEALIRRCEELGRRSAVRRAELRAALADVADRLESAEAIRDPWLRSVRSRLEILQAAAPSVVDP